MIKIDSDIIEFSDEELNAAIVLVEIYLRNKTNSPKIKELLEKRKEMMDLERWTRDQIAKQF